MSTPRPGIVLQCLRKLTDPLAEGVSDHLLLERFASHRDEAAFGALMNRHGTMVLSVCKRILRDVHAAEDAFQAAFLALANQASAIRTQESVGSWLYRVAHRLAWRTHHKDARRSERERQVPPPAPADAEQDITWRELRQVLDEELHRLPEKFRAPLLLCYLEGRTRDEAAAQLGWTVGMVKSRLERGREALRSRLERRGLVLGAALLGALLGQSAASAVPPELANATLKAAPLFADGLMQTAAVSAEVAALVQGVARETFVGKLRFVAAVLAFTLVGAGVCFGVGLAARDNQPVSQQDPPARAEQLPPKPAEGWKDEPLPSGALSRFGTARFRHSVVVSAVAASPDGKIVASGSHLGTIRLWEAGTGKDLGLLNGHGGGIYSLVFSPDGKSLVSGSYDKTVMLWDVPTRKQRWKAEGHQNWVWSVAFSPDGKTVASGSHDRTARLWDAATGRALHTFAGHKDNVNGVAFTPDGKQLVSCGSDKTIRTWDVATGKEAAMALDHPAGWAVAFSPDGKVMATGGGWGDSTVYLWDTATGKELHQCKGHERGTVSSLVFTADGKTVFSANSDDSTIRRWDVATGKERLPCARQRQVLGLARAGKDTVISGGWDNVVRTWDVETGKERHRSPGHQDWVWSAAFSPDGKLLASAGGDRVVRLWDWVSGKELRVLEGHEDVVRSVAISPDGKRVAAGGNDKTVRVWDASTGKELKCLKAGNRVKAVAFSADGKFLAAAGGDDLYIGEKAEQPGEVRVWDATTGAELKHLGGFKDGMKCVAFSPDNQWLLAGGNDGTARLWDRATGREVRTFGARPGAIEAVAFSPDGKWLALGGYGGEAELWAFDAKEAKVQKIRAMHSGDYVTSLAFSADSRLLASASSDPVEGDRHPVRLWEVDTGTERARYAGQQNKSYGVALSPDGRALATASPDTTVLVWDLTSRQQQGKLPVVKLSDEELAAALRDLTGDDGAKAQKAVWTLVAAAPQSLPLFVEKLPPAGEVDHKRLGQLLKDLDHDDFKVREKATDELVTMGERIEAELRKVLVDPPSTEVKQRVEFVLRKVGGKGGTNNQRLQLRGLEVLECLGTADARKHLEELSKGDAKASLTGAARAALQRLDARAATKRN